jgi:hypothetical protein
VSISYAYSVTSVSALAAFARCGAMVFFNLGALDVAVKEERTAVNNAKTRLHVCGWCANLVKAGSSSSKGLASLFP